MDLTVKKTNKQDRERKVLIGLIELYLKYGKPIGSNTLKEAGFEDLSSATIRNYFARLEEEGYLMQQHTSGGRIPTNDALRLYAKEIFESPIAHMAEEEPLRKLRQSETREITAFLQKAAETLSSLTKCAVFLSAPRFDQDFITDIKLLPIDASRCLCAIITDFGTVQTEVLPLEQKLSSFAVNRIESYFRWRLTGQHKPENLKPDEEEMAQRIYKEMQVRYIVGYSNFKDDELYRTGFSTLLGYPEFHDPQALANTLALFENGHSLRLLLKESSKKDQLRYWIGEDLSTYASGTPDCTVLTIPYHINMQPAGAVGILGPVRMPYRPFFGLLTQFSRAISETLTRSVYKFKISLRPLEKGSIAIQKNERLLLLEDQRKE